MSTLRQLIETLGETLLECVVAPKGLDDEVRDVLVYDSTDPTEIGPGDLVLGIGIASIEDSSTLTKLVGNAEGAGLLLKSHVLTDEHRSAAEAAGVSLVAVQSGTSWSQLLALLQAALRRGGFQTGAEELGGLDAGDLFGLADAISALVDAPLTIEDRLSRVIAYSSRQEEADAARAETIVGRKVPDRFIELFEQRGVFDRLCESGEALYLDDVAENVMPRLAVAVKAGEETLGYLWAAYRSRPSPEQIAAFEGAAKMAALHLLQHRAGADIERRIEADLVAAALAGGGAARDALSRLGLADTSLSVMAVATAHGDLELAARTQLQVRDILSAEFVMSRITAHAAILGAVMYVLVRIERGQSIDKVLRVAEATVERIRSRLDAPVLIGIGDVAHAVRDIPRSRHEADAALRVLRSRGWDSSVAAIEDVRAQALILRLGEVALEEKDVYMKKIQPLLESDTTKGTDYVSTLGAFLDSFGDIAEASKRLMVHPNTLRYRLVRLQELADIDLSSQNDRFALMVLLRAFPSDASTS